MDLCSTLQDNAAYYHRKGEKQKCNLHPPVTFHSHVKALKKESKKKFAPSNTHAVTAPYPMPIRAHENIGVKLPTTHRSCKMAQAAPGAEIERERKVGNKEGKHHKFL